MEALLDTGFRAPGRINAAKSPGRCTQYLATERRPETWFHLSCYWPAMDTKIAVKRMAVTNLPSNWIESLNHDLIREGSECTLLIYDLRATTVK